MGYVFDGNTSIITLTPGTAVLDLRNLYTNWKEWIIASGSMYTQAFSTIGGEPIDVVEGIYITSYFFLENGWKIRPQEASHKLKVTNGVLVVADGSDPFLQTLGVFNVLVQYSQPIKSETIATGGGGGGIVTSIQEAALTQIVDAGNLAGWSGGASSIVTVSGITPQALSQIVASGNAAGWASGGSTSGDFINTIDTISGIVQNILGTTSQFRFTDNDVWCTLNGEKVVVFRNEDKTGYTILTSNLEALLTSGGSPTAEALAQNTGGSRMFNRRTGSKLFSGRSSGSSGASQGEIDLRVEFAETMFGRNGKPQRGHWVVYRRFDLTTKSANFDEVYNTGVNGPAYAFADELVITRQDPVFSPEMAESAMPAGLLKGGQSIFYFEYDFRPTQNDQIYELDWDNHMIKPPTSILNGVYTKRYNIKEVFPYRLDGGRVEYYMAFCNTDLINY
ncbi:MAG TPA: hypothetical protein VI911_11060 [Patescibacteria group bacterium]|nr:hypothetical protein [Patescibacteria group bacterium]